MSLDSNERVTSRRPFLTKQQEIALAQRKDNGDIAARNELIERNVGLVGSIVGELRIKSSSMTNADLVQYGIIGLTAAVDKFNWKMGYRLSTYATAWIKKAIVRAITNYDSSIRIPEYLIGNADRVRREIKHRRGITKYPYDIVAIADSLGMSARSVSKLMYVADIPLSLDQPCQNTTVALSAVLTAFRDDYYDPVVALETGLRHEAVVAVIGLLKNPTDRDLIERYYGLNGHESASYAAIGDVYHVTNTTIAKRINVALKKLRDLLILNPALLEALRE